MGFASWFGKKNIAIIVCILCAIFWIVAEIINQPIYSTQYVLYWNSAIRFSVFLLFALLLNTLKKKYYERGDIIQQHSKALVEEKASRKHAETLIQRTLEQYRDMIENMSEAYVVWDTQLNILYCSPNVSIRTGYSVEEIKTLGYRKLIVPEDCNRVVDFYSSRAADGTLDTTCEFRIQCKDKRVIWLEMSTRILRDPNGAPIEFRTIARNITVLKEAAEVLQQSQNRVHDLFRQFQGNGASLPAKDIFYELPVKSVHTLAQEIGRTLTLFEKQLRHVLTFSSLASHELRTPLSIIRAQLEHTLRTSTSVEAIRDRITSVYDDVLTLNHIIDDLLDFSQLIAGTLRIKTQQINIRSFLQDFYDEGCILARSKDISLFFRLGPDITISADPTKLRQVLFNILDNAIKNTSEKGKIHMSYHIDGDYLVLQIDDNGIGIPEDSITKIFEPFYKGSEAHPQKSAGLGLTLVRALIEAHHGNLHIESEQDKGTTVSIQLPLHTPSE